METIANEPCAIVIANTLRHADDNRTDHTTGNSNRA